MKKILMSLALLGTFAAMTAKGDSYLYWMVDNAKSGSGESLTFTFAELSGIRSDGSVEKLGGSDAISDEGTSGEGTSTARNLAVGMSTFQGYDVSEFSSFLVELYNGETADHWVSQCELSYKDASAGIYEHLAPFSGGVAKFQTFNIPEPTSGLLMLFGLCGLALRRKRA